MGDGRSFWPVRYHARAIPKVLVQKNCGHTKGASKSVTDKLQRVMNAAGRVVSGTKKYDHGLTHLLHSELHWLDLADRVTYKLGVMVYKYKYKLPTSLHVLCQSATSEYSPPLPGSDSAPKSVVGVSHRVFHSRLKTHIFSRSVPP